MKNKIIIGTRGSKLAIAQAEYVKKILEEKNNFLEIELKIILTKGDKDLKSNWENSENSLKSFFTKEIEQELLDKKIDIAVHSMKDVPSVNPQGLICGAIPKREDNRDVIVSKNNIKLKDLPKNSVVGTSSLRRKMNLLSLRSDLNVEHLRGNIHTRLKKLDEGNYSAVILAAAGLKRVNLADRISEYLDRDEFIPAAGQGALYIQCREDDNYILDILKTIHDEEEEKIIYIERDFSKIFDGGCHTPMACYAKYINNNKKIEFNSVLYVENKKYTSKIVEIIENYKEIAKLAAKEIKEKMNE